MGSDSEDLGPFRGARPAQTDVTARQLEARIRGAIVGVPVEPIRIDRFIVHERLGAGGMGVVYAAFDPTLDRRIALKIVRADRDDAHGRVLAEARAMARLSHPNVVAVYDVSEFGGELYIAMELVAGLNLRDWLAESPRTIAQIVAVFVRAGRGLVAAHAARLIHGDIKPENILVGDGLVKVADFGLARADAASFEDRGGTPAYMAPEQLAGNAPDARSDQYAFAASLCEAITGSRPARASTPGALRIDAPQRVARALGRALSSHPAARFPSMAALLAALSPRPARRWPWGIAALAPAIVAATVLHGAARDPCDDAGGRIAAIWSPGVRAALPAAVARALDDYSASWTTMARATCEATQRGEQSVAMLDLRTSCLDRRLDELAEFIFVVKRTPVTGPSAGAAAAAFALSPIEPCADRDRLAGVLPPPAAQRPVVAALRARIDRARAQRETAEAGAALDDVGRVVELAGPLHYAPLLGEALLVRGELQHRAGMYGLADASFKDAAAAAAAGRDDDTLTEAWIRRGYTLGVGLGHQADAIAYVEAAEAIAARASHAMVQRADLREALGEILKLADRLPEARAALEEAVALFEQARGAGHPSVANALRQLSKLCVVQGDLVAARKYAERARAILAAALGPDQRDVMALLDSLGSLAFGARDMPAALANYQELLSRQRALGDDNPEVAATLGNLGNVLRKLGRDDEARAALERALGILERTSGLANDLAIGILAARGKLTRDPVEARRRLEDVLERRIALVGRNHSSVADAVNDLGNLARNQGDLAVAVADYTRALAIYQAALGANHPRVSVALSNLGELALQRGRFDDARRACTRARAIDEAALGAAHPDLAYDLACLGEAALGLGDPRGATELLERAAILGAAAPADDRARASFALARALWAGGGDRDRARALAAAAEPVAEPATLRVAVAHWLATHARPARPAR